MQTKRVIGLLLAAGKGVRFDPTGQSDKLLQPLADGTPVALAAARNLLAATACVIAVVRDGQGELARCLRAAGCRVVECPDAHEGMGVSLVCGVQAAADTDGCLIALADMPHVLPATLSALVDALRLGARIAAPVLGGRRGNPVAFAACHRAHLLQLGGDEGARKLLRHYPVHEVLVTDDGIFQDVDSPADLQRLRGLSAG